MQFSLDENINPRLCNILASIHAPCNTVQNTLGRGSDDADILIYVINNSSIFITRDLDFIRYIGNIKLILLHFNTRRTSWQAVFDSIRDFLRMINNSCDELLRIFQGYDLIVFTDETPFRWWPSLINAYTYPIA